MDNLIKQPLIDKIKYRFDKLGKVDSSDYELELLLFFSFLNQNEYTKDLLLNLQNSSKEFQEYIRENNPFKYKPQKEFEKYIQSYAIIKKSMTLGVPYPQWRIFEKIDKKLNRDTPESIKYFHNVFVGAIIEYLNESIIDQNIILSLLKRYKQRTEWFRKKHLFDLYKNNSSKAEKLLASDLYEYLFDNGVQIIIEPTSTSGKIDLISLQHYENPLLAEIKIFDPGKSKGKTYLSNGINQIYTYTQNYNESFGYLIVFNATSKDLRLSLTDCHKGIPYFHYNNKTIYVMVVDINDQVKTASKKGKIEYYDLNEKFIAKEITK